MTPSYFVIGYGFFMFFAKFERVCGIVTDAVEHHANGIRTEEHDFLVYSFPQPVEEQSIT